MSRYDKMHYNRCGLSGLLLPTFSLGLWHNFGEIDDYQNAKELVHLSFDQGITHFDLANNYGPPSGSAEITFGRILKEGLMNYRDELIISSKAGWPMWDGPYGDWGSKKHLMASLEQSLKRMQIDYVDIFYHHRPDPNTPLEESMRTLDLMVRQGKALYVGISSYDAAETKKAVAILNDLGTPCLIHQPKYSMLDRWVEDGLLDVLDDEGVGCITFSSLAQGLLTNRYINGIPKDSRATSGRGNGSIESGQIQPNEIALANALNEMAQQRGQSLAQMALAWVLKDKRITSVLLGVSRKEQLLDSLKALEAGPFSQEELTQIDQLLKTHS